MNDRVRVAVIGGGQSEEHEVSLASATAVAAAMDPASYQAVRLTIQPGGSWSDDSGPISFPKAMRILSNCDVGFPAVHGRGGEDGSLAALCQLAGIPWVGSSLTASALGMDKYLTKMIAESAGVRTTPGIVVTRDGASGHTVAVSALPAGPVVVKPVSSGSSHGVRLARTPTQIAESIRAALRLDDRVLIEKFIPGREVDVGLLVHPDGTLQVSPLLEVVRDELFDSQTKYDGSAQFQVPAVLDQTEYRMIKQAALRVFSALGCDGLARIDFFLSEGEVILNEVNTMPGMTPQSQFPLMYAAADVDYPSLLDILIRRALSKRALCAPGR